MFAKVVTQEATDNATRRLAELLGGTGIEVWPVGMVSIPTVTEEAPTKKVLFPERLPTAVEICTRFVAELASIGIVPQEVALDGVMKFAPVKLTLSQLNQIPLEAQDTFQQILNLPSSGYFNRWGVLVEVPPPSPPPTWRRDPWLAFQLGDSYFGVYHWD